ncbi:MAG: twin-arginine translocation signal domain-containing protein, partial [Gammaproteobacteria bacterium]|nr:twin-arginine translocation signal domain-containing protein [Gammaproteobacteria bacterium]
MINKIGDKPSSAISRRRFLQTSGALGLATASGGMSEIIFADGKKILKVRSYADMRSLDPAFSQGVTDEEIQSCIYSKLIQYQPGRKWGYQLDAAESIKQVSKTKIDFKLKRGIMFSGGFGEMTVEDVNFSFERFLDEELKSPNRPDWGTLKHIISRGKYDGSIEFTKAFQPAWNIA